jgi:LysM repeat protein
MKLGQGDRASKPAQNRLAKGLGPFLSGLLAAALVILTLLVAVVLGMQEQTLVAGIAPTATPMPTASLAPTRTALPSPVPPSPTAPPSVLPSPSPSPEPSLTPTSEPTAAPVTSCQIASGWQLYVVQRGDTFRSIALRYGISEYRLKQGNCLDATATAFAGERIYVPPLHPTCTKPSGWVNYTIQRGDTLSSIAARYGVSIGALKQANCLTSNTIYAGDTIWVPYYLPPSPTARPRPTSTRSPSRTPTLAPTGESPTLTPTATGSATPGGSATPTFTPEPTSGTPVPTPLPTSGTPVETAVPTETTAPPTATAEPTDTSVPPTATNAPTDTAVPPTNTPLPPTNTPLPPTNTPLPPTNTPTLPTATREP